MLRITIIALSLLVAPVAALAGQCPMLMSEVDAALETAQLSDADRARVMELRAQGEAEHEAGNHAASEAALNEAKGLLGI